MRKCMIMFIVMFLGLPTLTYAQPQKAKGALMALKRLEAKTQVGINYGAFRETLSNVKFPLNLLRESDEPKKYPELSKIINSAFQHFSNAGIVWKGQVSDGADATSLPTDSPLGKDISKLYPNVNDDMDAGGALESGGIFNKRYNYEALIKIMFHAASVEIEKATTMLAKLEEVPLKSQKPEEDVTTLMRDIAELRGEINKLKNENEILKNSQK